MSKKAIFWTLAAILMIGAALYWFMWKKPGKPAENKPQDKPDDSEAPAIITNSPIVPGSGFQEDCVTVPAGQSYDPALNSGLPPCPPAPSTPAQQDTRFPKLTKA